MSFINLRVASGIATITFDRAEKFNSFVRPMALAFQAFLDQVSEDASVRCIVITQEQFDTAAAERMENTGCISGAYELDFDARTFSALNIMDGWKAYAIDDIAAAAEAAFQESEISEDDRWRIFLDRLDGQELTTPGRLTVQNFYFEDSIEAMDDRILNLRRSVFQRRRSVRYVRRNR